MPSFVVPMIDENEEIDSPRLCTLCYESYEQKSRPRVLPCGHTYCTKCLEKLIRDRNLICPHCQKCHYVRNIENIAVNYSLEVLIASLSISQSSRAKKNGLQSFSHCEITSQMVSEKSNRCQELWISSSEMQKHLRKYEDYLKENIKLNKEAAVRLHAIAARHDTAVRKMESERVTLEDWQNQATIRCMHLSDAIADLASHVRNNSYASMAFVNECQESLEKWIDRSKKKFPAREVAISLQEVQESFRRKELFDYQDVPTRHRSIYPSASFETHNVMDRVKYLAEDKMITINILKIWAKDRALFDHKQVSAVFNCTGNEKSARISMKDGKVYLHSLRQSTQQTPLMIEWDLVKDFLKTKEIVAFLDVAWNGSSQGYVHILLTPSTLLSKQFVSLCLGENGPTYAGTKFFKVCRKNTIFEYILGGDYQYNNGTGGEAIVGINDLDERYSRQNDQGVVWTRAPQNNGNYSQFFINTGNGLRGSHRAIFGKVQDGMNVLLEAAEQLRCGHDDVEVVDCGVVVPLL